MTDGHVYTLGCKPGKATGPDLLLTVIEPPDGDYRKTKWRLQADEVVVDLTTAELQSPSRINKRLFRAIMDGVGKPERPFTRLLPYRGYREWWPVVGELMRAAGTIYAETETVIAPRR